MNFEDFCKNLINENVFIDIDKALRLHYALFPTDYFDLCDRWERDAQAVLGVSYHEHLVRLAQSIPVVGNEFRAGRKIQAIKELRAVALCGLKAAKDAVEAAF